MILSFVMREFNPIKTIRVGNVDKPVTWRMTFFFSWSAEGSKVKKCEVMV